jgi:hypothetical protein
VVDLAFSYVFLGRKYLDTYPPRKEDDHNHIHKADRSSIGGNGHDPCLLCHPECELHFDENLEGMDNHEEEQQDEDSTEQLHVDREGTLQVVHRVNLALMKTHK